MKSHCSIEDCFFKVKLPIKAGRLPACALSCTDGCLTDGRPHLHVVQHHAGHHHPHPGQQVGEQHLKTDGDRRLLLNCDLGLFALLLHHLFRGRLEQRRCEQVTLPIDWRPWAGALALPLGAGLLAFLPLAGLLRWFVFTRHGGGRDERGTIGLIWGRQRRRVGPGFVFLFVNFLKTS